MSLRVLGGFSIGTSETERQLEIGTKIRLKRESGRGMMVTLKAVSKRIPPDFRQRKAPDFGSISFCPEPAERRNVLEER